MNINRDYLIINDVKKSNVKLDNGSIFFYITDKNTQNIFVNLVINVSNNDLIQKYANIENAEDYTLTMNIVKPDNTYKIIEGKLHDKEKAIFEFNLNEDCCDEIGTYRCELLTKCNINNHEEITTSNKITYKVKSSILNDLDDIVEAPEYPLVIQLFDKLSDIEQYEEDRRANELARQLAEEQRQARFNVLDADMSNRIEIIDDKLVEIDNVLISKEDIADIKAKNTEQDRRLDVAENRLDNINTNIENVLQPTVQRVDAIEAINTAQNDRLDAIEVKNTQQDNRLDVAENRLANIGNDITNTMAPIINEHASRLDAIEAIDVSQNTRLDAIEVKNQQQDDRLLDIEKVNKQQAVDIKCLYRASQTMDITEEGNSIYLQNSNNGFAIVDEIKGNTLVNCNKEPDKELILNGNINTQGYSNVTLTEGVDGGLVDVALEGNTMVNVCDQKDPVEITSDTNTFNLKYLYTSTDYIIQFESDTEIVIDITLGGTTLLSQNIIVGINKINITTPSELIDNNLILNGEGFNASNIVVTQATDQDFGYFSGMKSVGELEENKIEILSTNKNLFDDELGHGYIRTNSGILVNASRNGVHSVNFIPVHYRETYTLHIETTYSVYHTVFCYDENFNYLNEKFTTGAVKLNNLTFTISNPKTKYIRFSMYSPGGEFSADNFDTILGITLGVGNTAVDYVPHAENKKQILLSEPLRAVGDAKDKYVLIDGEWHIERKCGVRAYQEGDKDNYITDMINTVYSLSSPTYEPIDYNPFEVYSDITHISNNSTIPCNMTIKNTGYNCLLKPSTTYTVSSNLGLNTVTTPSTLTEDCLRFYDTDTSDVTTMKDVTILEGDYTTGKPIPGHFSGIESAFEQEYDEEKGKYKVKAKVVGKNLFDKSKTLDGYELFYDNGTLVVNIDWFVATIEVKPNTLYRISGKADGYAVIFYDNNKKMISNARSGGNGYFTTPYNCQYVKVNGLLTQKDTFQLEQGTEATSYEPYKENIIEFYINEPLRGIGDAKDKVYVKDDKVVVERKCGVRAYQDGDFGTYLTDKVNTVYPLAEPVYEEVEYNDTKLFIESFKNSTLSYNSNIPVTSKLYYSYSVPIVDTVAQTANVTDQQDSMIIDLATQCAVLEMMLM